MKNATAIGIMFALALLLTGCGLGSYFEFLTPGEMFDTVSFRGTVAEVCSDVTEPLSGATIGCTLPVNLLNGTIKKVFCTTAQPDCWSVEPGFSSVAFTGAERDGLCFPKNIRITTKGR